MKANFILTLITFLFILSYQRVEATSNKSYRGYIITIEKDTIRGRVQMLSPTLNELKVLLIDKEGGKQHFKAKELKEYGFRVKKWNTDSQSHYYDYVIYVKKEVSQSPVALGPRNVLLEREVRGSINMYHHFIERRANIEEPYWHLIYLEKSNSGLVEVNKENYREILKELMNDYSEMLPMIEDRKFRFRHISQLLDIYNTWKSENEEETVLSYLND